MSVVTETEAKTEDIFSYGKLSDFEDILSDGDVPF